MAVQLNSKNFFEDKSDFEIEFIKSACVKSSTRIKWLDDIWWCQNDDRPVVYFYKSRFELLHSVYYIKS